MPSQHLAPSTPGASEPTIPAPSPRSTSYGSTSTATSSSELSSSPTPTVRNVSGTLPAVSQVLSQSARDGRDGREDLGGLGMGRPGRAGRDRGNPPLSPSISYSRSQSRGQSPGTEGAHYIPSEYSTDDESADVYAERRPPLRTADPRFMSVPGESTPRLGAAGSQRGPPVTAYGSSFGSPSISQGGSMPRPPRLPRNNSTSGHPVSHPVAPSSTSHPYGSTMRSTSRARPAIPHNGSMVALGRAEEDDELGDRGENLIRQRQKERKLARRERELEKQRRAVEGAAVDGEGDLGSAQQEEGYTVSASVSGSTQQRSLGPAAGRSVSRTRVPSSRRQPTDGLTSYAGSIAGDYGDTLSPRAALRAESVYSEVTADEDEEREREQEIIDDVVADAIEDEADEDAQTAEEEEEEASDEGVTLRDRQDAINIEHPFGLPIWKPALYRKSRSITRNAESALHSIPSAAAQRHLLPGNLLWVVIFGWWLAVVCFVVAVLVSAAEVLGGGRGGYGKTLRGLAWYVGWPFGKYVEGEGAPDDDSEHENEQEHEHERDEEDGVGAGYGALDSPSMGRRRQPSDGASSGITVRGRQTAERVHSWSNGLPDDPHAVTTGANSRREPTVSFANTVSTRARGSYDDEAAPLLSASGAGSVSASGPGSGAKMRGFRRPRNRRAKMLGRIVYWPLFFAVLAPAMLVVCTVCWGLVITIPMAKLTWALLQLLWARPLEINFRAAPKVFVPLSINTRAAGARTIPQREASEGSDDAEAGNESGSTTLIDESNTPVIGAGSTAAATSPSLMYRRAQLKAGQIAPTSGPTSTVLLCVYRAVGLEYYKYTVGGVNIIFINLLPLVFFTLFDAFVLLPRVEHAEHRCEHVSPFMAFIASQWLIFVLALSSVIPLSYFIGMAVASISAQSSIGMGAVINATFGSIIEIILYGIALTQGKGRLVEGSIVGSILAGVLLMPGASMCSGALKRKEQRFNAKSAGVTSTMLIMAIIGTLTPTMFYQIYGSFELHCDGCPPIEPVDEFTPAGVSGFELAADAARKGDTWKCTQCFYVHPDPVDDPFYQEQVKTLMYACAAVLLLSYLIGLWFSLRTHASQIWQNPQQLMKSDDLLHAAATGAQGAGANQALHPALKATLTQRMTPHAALQHVLPVLPLHRDGAGAGRRSNAGTVPPSPTMQAQGPMVGHGAGFGSLRSPKFGTLRLPKLAEERSASAGSTGSGSGSGPGGDVGGGASQREDGDGERKEKRISSANYNLPPGFTPYLESVPPLGTALGAGAGAGGGAGGVGAGGVGKDTLTPMRLPSTLTTEDFTRAVAVATVSALRHQRSMQGLGVGMGASPAQRSARGSSVPPGPGQGSGLVNGHGHGQGQQHGQGSGGQGQHGHGQGKAEEDDEDAHGGHEGPSWTRGVSAGVLLGCTLLYAMIAETLVDVVDVVLQGSKIDEKFLGLTLFTLVPNTTEFMNAMSFALQGNIALSMEIGSAYALQVCLLQIPAMVLFSALYDPGKMGEVVDTFTLIFPRWDVISIILAIFLLTYTYIEARSNYHRGSVLVLAYLVLMMGFYYAPVNVGAGPDGNAFGATTTAGTMEGGVRVVSGGWWRWIAA